MNTRNDKADLKDLHLMLIVFAVIVCCAISYAAGCDKGAVNKQREIENRAQKENLKGEEVQKVERIIFNSVQL